MEVTFAKRKLQKVCNNEKKLVGDYGQRMAAAIKERLAELLAAPVLDEMRNIPKARCHELTQNLKGYLAVDLVDPNRLVFRPEDPPPRKPDGGLDWTKVTRIVIFGIGDYH
jgi:proteic killer suppression protein